MKLSSMKALVGRVCEITTDRFVDAKQEWRWFAVRLLCSDLVDRFTP